MSRKYAYANDLLYKWGKNSYVHEIIKINYNSMHVCFGIMYEYDEPYEI
jgi:hypothetical protein